MPLRWVRVRHRRAQPVRWRSGLLSDVRGDPGRAGHLRAAGDLRL